MSRKAQTFIPIIRTGPMPNLYIAEATGLSRKTVNEHLAQGDNHSVYAEHLRQYSMMAPRVMDIVLKQTLVEHDIKAAKMYFDILEKTKGPNQLATYGKKNNYIQINNIVIKQETIQLLSPK